jgi:hypothetical protein
MVDGRRQLDGRVVNGGGAIETRDPQLEFRLQADRDAARRCDGGPGKQPGEVDDREPIREVPDVCLQPDAELRRLHDDETTRGVQ